MLPDTWSKTQVFLKQPRKTIDQPLVNHIAYGKRHESSRKVDDPITWLCEPDADGARELVAEKMNQRKAQRVPGRHPMHAQEIVVAGPPGYRYTEEKWSREHEREWAFDAFEWVRDIIGPHSKVIAAAWHKDESSPHIHVLFVPVSSKGRLAWRRVEEETALRLTGRALTGTSVMRWLHDDLHERVGKKCGLLRGGGHVGKHRGKALDEGHRFEANRLTDEALERERRAALDTTLRAELAARQEVQDRLAKKQEVEQEVQDAVVKKQAAQQEAIRLEALRREAVGDLERSTTVLTKAKAATEAEEARRVESQEARSREEAAARERNEALARETETMAHDLALGSTSRWRREATARGKEIRARYEADLSDVTSERDAVLVERDTALAERDAAVESLRTTEDSLQHQSTLLRESGEREADLKVRLDEATAHGDSLQDKLTKEREGRESVQRSFDAMRSTHYDPDSYRIGVSEARKAGVFEGILQGRKQATDRIYAFLHGAGGVLKEFVALPPVLQFFKALRESTTEDAPAAPSFANRLYKQALRVAARAAEKREGPSGPQ